MPDDFREAASPADAGDPPRLFDFDNSYARLSERFYVRQAPQTWPDARLVRLNAPLARLLGADPAALSGPDGVAVLAGDRVAAGSDPLAMAYAGHQFGGFSPQLGDGRALLLGEVVGTDGVRRDVQLKGSGRTPFSRMGDGRAAIGPVLREYIVGEAMAALGVRSTRALAALTTGEPVLREQPLPGAVLVRVAQSHVRVGTFQYFAARRDQEAIRALTDYVLSRHYPDRVGAARPALALLEAVIEAQVDLVASWMHLGFIHGVMNTDNCQLAGETIDYGPCAFMDAYHPGQVYSSIDHAGRYAYGAQPAIVHWNLVRFAETLLPDLAETEDAQLAAAQAAIDKTPELYAAAWTARARAKLGLAEARDGDEALALDLLKLMAAAKADFTNTWRGLADGSAREQFAEPDDFDAWSDRWRERRSSEGTSKAEAAARIRAASPAVIPRNHLVEEALAAAERAQDYKPFEALVERLSAPYEDRADDARLRTPPAPHEEVRATFCGT